MENGKNEQGKSHFNKHGFLCKQHKKQPTQENIKSCHP